MDNGMWKKRSLLNILQAITLVFIIIFAIFGTIFLIGKNNQNVVEPEERIIRFDYYSPSVSWASVAPDHFNDFYEIQSIGSFVKLTSSSSFSPLFNIYYVSNELIFQSSFSGFSNSDDFYGDYSAHWQFDFIYYEEDLSDNFYWVEYEESNKIILTSDHINNFSLSWEEV